MLGGYHHGPKQEDPLLARTTSCLYEDVASLRGGPRHLSPITLEPPGTLTDTSPYLGVALSVPKEMLSLL